MPIIQRTRNIKENSQKGYINRGKWQRMPAPFLDGPIRELGERTGLALSSALKKTRRTVSHRKATPPTFTRKQAAMRTSSIAPITTGILPVEEDSVTSTTSLGSNSFMQSEFPSCESSSSVSETSLSKVGDQVLFKSPSSSDFTHISMKLRLPSPFEGTDFQGEKDNSGSAHEEKDTRTSTTTEDFQFISLASLSGVSPRSLETILETVNEDHQDSSCKNDDDVSSESSSATAMDYQVSFSPSNDLFLRTLAMERVNALCMSELALEDNCLEAKVVIVRIISRSCVGRFVNSGLGLFVVLVLLIHAMGLSGFVIAAIQLSTRQLWHSILTTVRIPPATEIHLHHEILYNIHNEPMGVWLLSLTKAP